MKLKIEKILTRLLLSLTLVIISNAEPHARRKADFHIIYDATPTSKSTINACQKIEFFKLKSDKARCYETVCDLTRYEESVLNKFIIFGQSDGSHKVILILFSSNFFTMICSDTRKLAT